MPLPHPLSDPHITSFFLLGLLNNSSYVIMIAGAKNISEGSVALVFLCNVMPSFLTKLTSPLWFHRVSYSTRINSCMLLMSLSFLVVAFFDDYKLKLIGVCLASAQSGLGEASALALTSKYANTVNCLTAWSSGTGFAGIFGFAWVVALQPLGFTFTLIAANVLTVAFGVSFYCLLPKYDEICEKEHEDEDLLLNDEVGVGSQGLDSPRLNEGVEGGETPKCKEGAVIEVNKFHKDDEDDEPEVLKMSGYERCAFTSTLAKYMVPLFVVYFAEYAMQSGAWAAIGFPVTDEDSRKRFYTAANWTYQAGVFVSRSSGSIYRPSLLTVQSMPILQTLLLIYFYLTALYLKPLYSNILLLPCFLVGLLGGLVYVNAFSLISRDVRDEKRRELALSTASIADSFGIMCSDVVGLYLQSCIYEKHGIEGAKVGCPF
mmetsp:Transcript_15520/g.31987  ORF Transcript_15520/g.31987 Transcript_15520/m.31987 type:complete len:431 (+) Transcript_15520:288-1580(+)